jgi:hypothetical protein
MNFNDTFKHGIFHVLKKIWKSDQVECMHIIRFVIVRHAYTMRTGSYAFPCPSKLKGRNHVQTQSKFEILMLFLGLSLRLFRMVYLYFLYGESNILKMRLEFKYSFVE